MPPVITEAYTYDDLSLIPQRGSVKSRKDVDYSTKLGPIKLKIPIISANMDTITGHAMAVAMSRLGGLGILHRFMTPTELEREVSWARQHTSTVAFSVGLDPKDLDARLAVAIPAGGNIICVDVAHGHHERVISVVRYIRNRSDCKYLPIIAGNVVTGFGAGELINAGADVIKVGIGPGSLCTTRVVTGCGYPQLSAIFNVVDALDSRGDQKGIIADGGIRASGDIVKALAAGAHAVMVGGLLAGAEETPGEYSNGQKLYRGMVSRSAQEDWKHSVSVVEGEMKYVTPKGKVGPIIERLLGGLTSGMSYNDAHTLSQHKHQAEWVRVTLAGLIEGTPHGLK